jgi:hypothetical protein
MGAAAGTAVCGAETRNGRTSAFPGCNFFRDAAYCGHRSGFYAGEFDGGMEQQVIDMPVAFTGPGFGEAQMTGYASRY